MLTLCMTSSPVALEALLLSILKTLRTPRRPKSVLTGWNLMAAGSEWISQSQSVPTLPHLESTWDVQRMVVVVVVAAVEEVAAAAVVHHGAPPGTTTEATTEAMTGVMIGIMIAMMNEITGLTDADLRLLTTAEGTALDPAHGPIHHVTTDKRRVREEFTAIALTFAFLCYEFFSVIFQFFLNQVTCVYKY